VLGLSVLYSLFGRPDWAQIGPVPYFLANGAFIAAVWAASSGRAQMFAVPWLVGIGTCSYSLYLLHLPVKLIFGHFSGQLMGHFWFLVLVVFPTAIGLSLLVQTYIERPAQLWAKGWAARARPVRGTVW
jgi:peptidoglycan/LPS O-acetylase OafA/YrhL